jgi:hypothetical protein
VSGDHIAVDSFAFLSKPLNERGCVTNLATRFIQGLALLSGENVGQVVTVFKHELKPAAQYRSAICGCSAGPLGKSCGGSGNCATGLCSTNRCDTRQHRPGCWVVHVTARAIIRNYPRAANVTISAPQTGIAKPC